MKGLLCSQGYQLYAPVWNDQPPLHTALLSALFRAFGPSAFAGRLLTLGFASVLLAALLASVGTREGTMAALIAGGFLLGMPFFLMLSVSVMLEIPAFAVGLVSAWLLVRWVERGRWTWLALSGAFMGAALMIKLTVALLLPGMVVEIVLAGWRSKSEARATTIMRMLAVWAAVTALVVAGAVWFSPGMTFGQIIGNHFNQALRAATAGNPGMTFSFTGLWSVFYCLFPAALAVLLRALDGRFPSICLPTLWFVTEVLTHRLHRPFWGYYYVHFAFPLAWLAAVGIKDLGARAFTAFAQGRGRLSVKALAWLAMASLVCGVSGTEGSIRAVDQWRWIRQRAPISSHPLVARM